jgi:hypothetical protein
VRFADSEIMQKLVQIERVNALTPDEFGALALLS